MEVPRNKHGRIGVVGWLAITLALLGMGGMFLLQRYLDARQRARIRSCRVFASNLRWAMKQYQVRFGAHPHGDADAILEALRGQNPAKVVFFDVSQSMQDTNGVPLDPWRTPYLIETNLTNSLTIRSAGPNRHFGDADDLEQSL